LEIFAMMIAESNTQNKWSWLKWLGISLVIFILDQITKHAVTANFQLGDSKYILPFFNLVLAHNTGAAFSFLANASGFIAVTVIITAVLLWMMRSNRHNRLLCVALSLVIGGAFGNLYDRVLHGYVVDFVQWHAGGYYWPAFNIADSAICIGAALLVWDSFRKPNAATTS
jgi:signal peptidase II